LLIQHFLFVIFPLKFQSEKEDLFDSIKAELEEKIRCLEEDKNNVDFSSGLWEQSVRSVHIQIPLQFSFKVNFKTFSGIQLIQINKDEKVRYVGSR